MNGCHGEKVTDTLRARIAAAILKEDQLRVCKLSDADIRYITDAILAIPGIAVVELPPHDTSGPFAEWRVVADRSTVVWTAAQGRVMIQNVEPGDLTADEARDFAAALLAAADYAERDQVNGEAICRNCGTEIEFVSQRPDEGWEKQWRHLPSGMEVVGPRRCPIYAEPVEGIDGYCTCHPDQRGMTADCGVRQHRRAANHWKERDQ